MSQVLRVMVCSIAIVAATAIGSAQTQQPTPQQPTATTTPQVPAAPEEKPPLAGANSFTEAQAKERIGTAGYQNISDLQKDNAGIWRGTAMKEGKQVKIALDFRGNVVASE